MGRTGGKGWAISDIHLHDDYLGRHGLHSIFSSRARAIDAVRMALMAEPRPQYAVSTGWKRVGKGVYLSRDGHWQLNVTILGSALQPRSEDVSREFERHQNLWPRKDFYRWPDLPTLYACARRTDQINLQLGLNEKPAGPGV